MHAFVVGIYTCMSWIDNTKCIPLRFPTTRHIDGAHKILSLHLDTNSSYTIRMPT